MLLVGHVTKDGSIAGPRVLEHLVDVVLSFEGDRHSTLRMVRGVKNRFGPADEVGCFELRDAGIVGMPDPSGLFLDRFGGPPVPGTAVTVVMDGRRPLPAELQALVTGKDIPSPRRAVSGLDNARVAMLLAVLESRAGVRLHDAEVYAATVGGMRVIEPAADLALALAITSARRDVALPPDVVVLGEIGLAGEVRRVAGVERRLAEAARLGFTHALVPPDSGSKRSGLRVRRSATWRSCSTTCVDSLAHRVRRNGVGGLIRSSSRTIRRYEPAGTTVRGCAQPGVVVRSPHVSENATGRPGTSVRRSVVGLLSSRCSTRAGWRRRCSTPRSPDGRRRGRARTAAR